MFDSHYLDNQNYDSSSPSSSESHKKTFDFGSHVETLHRNLSQFHSKPSLLPCSLRTQPKYPWLMCESSIEREANGFE
ncbi:hypothetical protein P8452_17515 [Trifolium repens]|nr:hypothetical protein P8452_17515 [Trifolium repens]